ncbi:hypothetical protein EDB84DRAFT_970917 [Lactarius hengduanensis]|nr:hypothetical protein EDB84DRAFT_970917 [Lactarius hengduanensis]
MSKTPLSSRPRPRPPPPKAPRLSLPSANVTEIGTTIPWTSYPPTPLHPPHDYHLLGAAAQDQETEGTGQLMAYVLVPPLPPGARKSDYMPVKQRSHTRQRQTAAKGKARAGDNAGPKELVHVLQVAFENNWPGAGSTGPSGKTTKKAAKETVVVVDDEDDDEEDSDKSKIPTPLDEALAAAFTYNSTNPNVVASASAPAAITTRRSAKETRAEAPGDSASVEVIIPLPTKRARTHARAQALSPRRKGKRHLHTPTTSPRRQRPTTTRVR